MAIKEELAFFELLEIKPQNFHLFLDDKKMEVEKYLVGIGHINLRDAGIKKLSANLTDLKEINRILNTDV